MLLPRANPNAPHPFDLILCDLMLPGLTGEELIANLRNHGDTTPVIVVSARTACTDRVALLRMGADDYICKPFDLDELAARVDVQLRRRTVEAAISHSEQDKGPRRAAGKGILTFNNWRLDPSPYVHRGCASVRPHAHRVQIDRHARGAPAARVFQTGALRGRMGRAVCGRRQYRHRTHFKHSSQTQADGNRRLHQNRLGHGL